jgi:magnesium transporter
VFKVIDLPPEGKPQETTDLERVAPPPPGTVRWIDLIEPDADALELLRARFDLHPLTIRDCAEYGRQSKLDDFDRYLFIVLHAFTADPADPASIQIHEIHAFLGGTYLITVHDNPVPAQEEVWRDVASDRAALARGPSWALYLTIETLVESSFPLIDAITERLDTVEDQVLSGVKMTDLTSIFRTKRQLVDMRRVVRPLRDVIGILHRRVDDRITERTALHLRDAYDHVVRCSEAVEEAREVAGNVLSAYETQVSNRTNEIMKRLTIFSAVFLPLGFLVGFWGQNFEHLPFSSDTIFWLSMASMVVVPVALLYWFKRNWF